MTAFTTTSPASGYIINTLIAIAGIAVAGLVGSYLIADRAVSDEAPVATPHADTAAGNINPGASY